MNMIVQNSELRLTILREGAVWAGDRHLGLPLLRWHTGALCEPVTIYFGYSLETHRVRPGSLKQEAYTLREWMVFLLNSGRHWRNADDDVLKSWRAHMRKDPKDQNEKKRLERKIQVVFDFYRLLPYAMPFSESGERQKIFVGELDPRQKAKPPITSKQVISVRPNAGYMWAFGERCGSGSTRRPTPNEEQAERLATHVRSRPERQVSRRTGGRGPRDDLLLSERNWLIARCAAEAGLRVAEIAGLTIVALLIALSRAGVLRALRRKGKLQPEQQSLETYDDEARQSVLSSLAKLSARGRKVIEIGIVGKGQKIRMVPFPIALVEDLLQIGLWSLRSSQVSGFQQASSRRPNGFNDPGFLFLSMKRRGQLSPGAIGDILKSAFNSLGIEGSGHRLRAFYATMEAAKCLEQSFITSGGRLDMGAIRGAADHVAALLGHSKVNTTIRHYVELGQLLLQSDSYRSGSGPIMGLWAATLRNREKLSPDQKKLVTRLINQLADSEDDSILENIVAMALNDQRAKSVTTTSVSGLRSSGAGGSKLRLVE